MLKNSDQAVHYLTKDWQRIYKGTYMSAHVLLHLLNELGKRDKMYDLQSNFYLLLTSLINSIIQEHEC